MTTVQTLPALCAALGITAKAVPGANPHIDPTWPADHWSVTLTRHDAVPGGGYRMPPVATLTTAYSTGLGLRKNGRPVPPKVEDVLDSLRSDATLARDYANMDEMRADMGGGERGDDGKRWLYRDSEDYARAVLSWQAMHRTLADLRKFFGPHFADFMACEGL